MIVETFYILHFDSHPAANMRRLWTRVDVYASGIRAEFVQWEA